MVVTMDHEVPARDSVLMVTTHHLGLVRRPGRPAGIRRGMFRCRPGISSTSVAAGW